MFATAVTNPEAFTLTLGLLDDQTIVRPVSTFPAASFAVAVSCVVCVSATDTGEGVTVTVATGVEATEIVDVDWEDPLVAVIVVAPTDTPVTVTKTCPLVSVFAEAGDTVAAVTSDELKVTSCPVIGPPLALRSVAVSCVCPPTLTLAFGGVRDSADEETVMFELPLIPSEAAKMSALPPATAVTSPVWVTVATDGAPVSHVMTRPGRAWPCASFGVAVSCVVPPIDNEAVEGVTSMLAMATGVTVTIATEDSPSDSAVMRATPCVAPVTSPVFETVAIVGWSLDHVNWRPPSTLPLPSLAVAVSCTVPPAGMVTGDGATRMLAIGTGETVITDVPCFPSAVAVIVTFPGASPTTSPLEETVATVLSPELQVMARPVSAAPEPSRGVAESWMLDPTVTSPEGGATAIDAIGTAVATTRADPLTPSTAAEMVALPGVSAVTTPVELTVTDAAFDDDQRNVLPATVWLPASRASATSVAVSPTIRSLVLGVTRTTETGRAVTVMFAMPDFPPLLAATVVVPDVTPVTVPVCDTVAIVGFCDDQNTLRPARDFPSVSVIVTFRDVEAPTATLALMGCT